MKITTLILISFFATNSLIANIISKETITSPFSKVTTDPVMPILSNLSVCDDNNDGIALFNLTMQTPIILGAQSSASSNYTVSYFLTQTDAIMGFNAIGTPSMYFNMTNQQTVFARVVNNGTTQYAVGSFSLIANPTVIPTFSGIGPICQGTATPSLPSVSINGITGTWFPSTISTSVGTYTYTFTPSAVQCAYSTTMNITVNPLPTITTNVPPLQFCDTYINDGITTFDLTTQVPMILGGQTGLTVNFYPSLSDATNNTNIITNPSAYNNTTPYLQTIGIRVTNTSGCYSVSSMNIKVNPAPTINAPADFSHCDDDGTNDGYYTYNLSALIPNILGSQNPSNFTVNFYDNQMSAEYNVNPITDLVNYQTYTHSIWIRVNNNTLGCYAISHFNTTIEQAPTPVITSNSNIICVDYLTHDVVRDATLTALNTTSYLTQSSPSYTYQWLDASGTPLVGVTSATYNVNSPFPNSTSVNFSVMMSSTSALGCSSFSPNFVTLQSGPASPIDIGYSIVNNAGNQTVTVEVQGYGIYEFSIDGGQRQTSNVFSNVALGTHSITIWDSEGGITFSCNPLVLSNVDVNLIATPAPTGNTLQSFIQGATLANMQVTGQNIKWYSGINKVASSMPLPLNTILVNGTTYYASQKIGGYESATRLPVTAQIVLNNVQFELKGLTYEPNPVDTNLSVKSDDIIDSISIYNFLGQLVSTKKYNATTIQLDTTSLSSGNYFVKVTSENKQSTIKIEKK